MLQAMHPTPYETVLNARDMTAQKIKLTTLMLEHNPVSPATIQGHTNQMHHLQRIRIQ